MQESRAKKRIEIGPVSRVVPSRSGFAAATVFPQAIGMAASWNPELIEEVGAAIASEARAKHEAAQREGDHGMYKGLTFFAPNINLFRDPRWGRGHETYGEAPTLTARLGVAYIRASRGLIPKIFGPRPARNISPFTVVPKANG